MATVTGIVEKIPTKEFNGKLLYSVVIQGKFYGTGSKKPQVQVGDCISFEAVAKGAYMNADFSSIKKVEVEAEMASPNTPFKATQAADAVADLKAYDNKSLSVAYSFSYDRALASLKLFSELGLTLPTISKAKPNEQLDLFLGLVEATTERIFKVTQDHVALNALLTAEVTPAKVAAKAVPKPRNEDVEEGMGNEENWD